MTNGQIQQLQDLSKCTGLERYDENFVKAWWFFANEAERMGKREKAWLRRLTHQYRNQIQAIKRNQERA